MSLPSAAPRLLLPLLLGLPCFSQTLAVVDSSGAQPPLGVPVYTDLGSALAGTEDVVLVRSDTYANVGTLSFSRSVIVVADGPVVVQGTATFDAPGGSQVIVRGLDFEIPGTAGPLDITTKGVLMLESCTVYHEATVNNASMSPAVHVRPTAGCPELGPEDVSFTRCSFLGEDALNAFADGGHGLVVDEAAQVFAYDCAFAGGLGSAGKSGGTGAFVLGLLWASGSEFRGGDGLAGLNSASNGWGGGPGPGTGGTCTAGGHGGNGASVEGDVQCATGTLVTLDCTLLPGLGGSSPPGTCTSGSNAPGIDGEAVQLVGTGSHFVSTGPGGSPDDSRHFELSSPVRIGASSLMELEGVNDDVVKLHFGVQLATITSGQKGPRLIDIISFPSPQVALSSAPSAPVYSALVPVNLPSSPVGWLIFQPVFRDLAGYNFFGPPSLLLALDPAL